MKCNVPKSVILGGYILQFFWSVQLVHFKNLSYHSNQLCTHVPKNENLSHLGYKNQMLIKMHLLLNFYHKLFLQVIKNYSLHVMLSSLQKYSSPQIPCFELESFFNLLLKLKDLELQHFVTIINCGSSSNESKNLHDL